MREMKDSGFGYLGEIPAHWRTERIKNHLRFSSDKNPGDATVLSLYREHGIVPKDSREDNHNVTSEDTSNYRYVCVGDFVVNKMKAWQGSMGVSAYEGVVSPAYYVYRFTTDAFDKKYLHYLLRSQCYADEFRRLSGGIRIGQWDLPKVSFETTCLAVPPKKEQTAIAQTIDVQLSKVDTLIANVQAQIEKLKAYEQSLITEVVTKGLDPTVPMKDSGVEWIGEIPAHWEITRIKNKFELRNERNDEADLSKVNLISLYTDLGVVQHSDLTETTGNRAVTAEGYKIVHKNDIVVNIILCWMGAVGMSKYDGVTSPAYDIYCPLGGTLSEYYHYLFRTPRFNGECYRYGRGIMMMRWRTYSTEFRSITIPCPPVEEQHQIIGYLNKKCAEIDRLIAIKQQKIEKLNDYKKSLIYEYVTGKKEA